MAKSNRLPRSHKDYWKDRVFKQSYKDKSTGQTMQVGHFSVRLSYRNRRETFSLNTSNRKLAADLAKEIDVYLRANGWADTINKYKDEAIEPDEIRTIGDLIRNAERKSEVKPRTFRQNRGSLRRIVGFIKGIKSDDRSKYRPDLERGGKWQEKIDRIHLDSITHEMIQDWRKKQLANLHPKERQTKGKSIDSTINQARSLWKYCDLQNPFSGFKWKQTARRFQPSTKAGELIYKAKQELEQAYPEAHKALVLCMFFGLRRSEADCLTWEQVLTQEKKIRIETTPYFSPKSENSEREIPIQESVLRDLVRWKEEGHPVFVLDGGEAKPNCPYTYYRAAETWDTLIEWLRKNGVNKRTPIHYLRGLAGSLMYETNDVYAAQRYLGHSDIRTTIGSYLHEGAKTFEIVPEKPTS